MIYASVLKTLTNSILLAFLILAAFGQVKGQIVSGQNAIDVDAGKSDLGYIIHAGFIHFYSSKFSVKENIFYESANPYQLTYYNCGIEALARYRIIDLNEIFFLTPYAGVTMNYDQLSGVRSTYSNSFNYGLKAGAEVEAVLNDSFSFVGFFNQLALLRTKLGNERYDYGIGVRFYLGN